MVEKLWIRRPEERDEVPCELPRRAAVELVRQRDERDRRSVRLVRHTRAGSNKSENQKEKSTPLLPCLLPGSALRLLWLCSIIFSDEFPTQKIYSSQCPSLFSLFFSLPLSPPLSPLSVDFAFLSC